MSVKQMGRVWDLDLPTQEKIVLLAMADHAWDDGSHVFPSVRLIAKKAGLSTRQTQRVLARLRDNLGLIELTEDNSKNGKANEYRLTLGNGGTTEARTPDRQTRGVRHTGHGGYDTAMSPEPSENRQQPSEKPSSDDSGLPEGSGRTSGQELMDDIYDALRANRLRLDGAEYSYNLGKLKEIVRNDDPTDDEIAALPAACVEYFEWHGKLDAAKALRRLRQQNARRERERAEAVDNEGPHPTKTQADRAAEGLYRMEWYAGSFASADPAWFESARSRGLTHEQAVAELEDADRAAEPEGETPDVEALMARLKGAGLRVPGDVREAELSPEEQREFEEKRAEILENMRNEGVEPPGGDVNSTREQGPDEEGSTDDRANPHAETGD